MFFVPENVRITQTAKKIMGMVITGMVITGMVITGMVIMITEVIQVPTLIDCLR